MEDKRICSVCARWPLNDQELRQDVTKKPNRGLHHPNCVFAGSPVVDRRSEEERRNG